MEGKLLEISPLLSYEGEGLEEWANANKGKIIKLPLFVKNINELNVKI